MRAGQEIDSAAAEDGRGPARRGGRVRELVVARVEGVVPIKRQTQVVAEDDAARGQHRRAAAGVGHVGLVCDAGRLVRGVRKTGMSWCVL